MTIFYSSFVTAFVWCDSNAEGLCIKKLNEDDNKVRAWFDRSLYFETLIAGYNIKSERYWFSTSQEVGIYAEWSVADRADYSNDRNESVWFTAYRAREAQCWMRSEQMYFYENWAGTNFIQKPSDRSDPAAKDITIQMMIDRINIQGVLIDSSGQQINFCNGEKRVSQSAG